MIKDNVTVDISVVKGVTKIDKAVEKIDEEIGTLEAALKKDKSNKDNWKKLQALKKEREGQEDEYTKIEKSLKTDLANLSKLCKTIAAAISATEARKDLPDAAKAELAKQSKINFGTRDKQITILEALQADGKLRTEPAKLTRLCDDLEADVKAFNDIETKIESLIDEDFAHKWGAVEKTVAAMLATAKVQAQSIDTDAKLATSFAALKKNRWKNYDAKVDALTVEFQKLIDIKANENALTGLLKTRMTLNGRQKLVYIDKAKQSNTPVATAAAELDLMLAAQRTPRKEQWVKALNMAKYQVIRKGKFEAYDIHITFDNNSWSAAAKAGAIDVSTGTPKQLLEAMFGNAVAWQFQAHATLEIEYAAKKYPHVYFGGHHNHWDQVEATQGKTPAWSQKARDALTRTLDTVKDEIEALIKIVKDKDGDVT
jgi:hypothetical protein